MPRTALWTSIHAALSREIADKHYGPGDKLPTEAQLAERFGVNRHTIRRALAELQSSGLVFARRGAGVFVAQNPTDYPIGRRIRFHQNLLAAGRTPRRSVQHCETRAADAKEAEALQIEPESIVHIVEGLSLADEAPIARYRSVFPKARLPGFLAHLREDVSITEALRKEGVFDYTRASTRIDAKIASATIALHLQIREGAPVLRTIGINVDPNGVPIEYGRTWFAADRVTLTLSADELG
ncbi:MAG: phosphonate metabolism transcriptional regulator PhnF [Pseudomonadota bacterium]